MNSKHCSQFANRKSEVSFHAILKTYRMNLFSSFMSVRVAAPESEQTDEQARPTDNTNANNID